MKKRIHLLFKSAVFAWSENHMKGCPFEEKSRSLKEGSSDSHLLKMSYGNKKTIIFIRHLNAVKAQSAGSSAEMLYEKRQSYFHTA